MNNDTTRAQVDLAAFIDRYDPAIAAIAVAALAKMRKRIPGAVEIAYDNYNALAIGFGPNERASDAIFSVVLYPRWVSFFFLQRAAELPDPAGVLKGRGNVVRHVVLKAAADLDALEMEALIACALERAKVPVDLAAPSRLVIKSISKKQRARRP